LELSWAVPEEIKQKVVQLFLEISKVKPPKMVKNPKNGT